MEIAPIVNIITAVFALVAAWFAFRERRGDVRSKLLADLQKAYDHKCQETTEAWKMVDKLHAELDDMREVNARKDIENAKLWERFARRKLENNGKP